MRFSTAKIVIVIALVCVFPLKASASTGVINNFAFNAAKLISQTDNTYFFSPYSIISTLGMVYAGAVGATAKEMEDALGFSPQLHSSMSELILSLEEDGQVFSANRIWLHTNLKINRDYQYKLLLSYGSRAIMLDTKNDPEGSCKTVNDWVNWMTKGRIPTMLNRIDPSTQILLTNAVYFKADWARKFDVRATGPEKFYDGGRTTEVQMMKQEDRFEYAEAGDVKALRLQYEGRKMSMLILLPSRNNPSALEGMDNEKLGRIISSLRTRKVDVWLPKFRAEDNYQLEEVLKEIGVRLAFTDDAEFSGITSQERLKIDAVIHKTFVEVNESGTEAAAATAIQMVGATALPPEEEVAEFRADHPFEYIVLDNRTGTILFIGRQTF